MGKYIFVRNLDARPLLENFFIFAVVSILGIRVFLTLTNFPQIGGSGFHVSHMLFGGLFMLTALLMLLTLTGKSVLYFASILAGLGFGTFIDELGKFITSDNNYFYQPTFSLIYIIFVFLYMSIQIFGRLRDVTKEEYLINSLSLIQESVLNDFDIEEKKQANLYLEKANPNHPITIGISELLHQLDVIEPQDPSFIAKLRTYTRNFYFSLARHKNFKRVLIIFFLGQSLINITIALLIILAYVRTISLDTLTSLTTNQFFLLAFSLVASLFIILGMLRIRRSIYDAYRFFKYGQLVTILGTQVFAFYQSQFAAFIFLLFNISILMVLNFLLELEKGKKLLTTDY